MDEMNMMNNLVNGANIKFDTSDLLNRLQAASYNAGKTQGMMLGWDACNNKWLEEIDKITLTPLPPTPTPTKPKKRHTMRKVMLAGLVVAGGYYILDKYVIKPKKAEIDRKYEFECRRREKDFDTDFDFEVDEDELH